MTTTPIGPTCEEVGRRLDGVLAEAAGARNAAEARIVAAAADALDAEAWQGWGIQSAEHWLSWNVGASRSRARVYTAIARRRDELPASWNLFGQGLLSVDQMRLITRHCPSQYDTAVAEFAVAATVVQLSRSLRDYHWDTDVEADPPDDVPEPTPVRRSAVLHLGDDGEFDLRVTGPAVDGAMVKAALEQFCASAGPGADGDDHEVRAYDGFLAMVEAAVGADPSTSRRNRHRLLCHLDIDDAGKLVGRLHLGPVLGQEELRFLACDADLQTLFEDSGHPFHLGRTRRTVPSSLRHVVVDRDRCCRFPGCGRTVNLDVHHLIHWADGGPTDLDNLVTLCSLHHRLHHQGHFTIRGNPMLVPRPGVPDGLTFRNPHGVEIRHVLPISPEGNGPLGPTYQKGYGERLDYRWLHFHADPRLN